MATLLARLINTFVVAEDGGFSVGIAGTGAVIAPHPPHGKRYVTYPLINPDRVIANSISHEYGAP